MNPIIIPTLIDVLALAYLGLEDFKFMSVKHIDSRIFELAMLMGLAFLAYFSWQIAFLEVVIGVTLYLVMKKQMKQLFREVDNEMILVTLVTSTVAAVIGLLSMLAYHIAQEWLTRRSIRYPALFHYLLAFGLGAIITILFSM